jgi:plastocyanin
VDDFRLYPDMLTVQEGVPVTFHNISLIAEHQVSIKPFHDPENVNVMPGQITQIEFTPDEIGVFTIQHELHGFRGELVVEAGLEP